MGGVPGAVLGKLPEHWGDCRETALALRSRHTAVSRQSPPAVPLGWAISPALLPALLPAPRFSQAGPPSSLRGSLGNGPQGYLWLGSRVSKLPFSATMVVVSCLCSPCSPSRCHAPRHQSSLGAHVAGTTGPVLERSTPGLRKPGHRQPHSCS